MDEAISRAVLYGLVAAASPLAFAATLVVLRSHRGRLNGAIFATAFLLAGLGVVLIVVAIDSAATLGHQGSRTVAAGLELVIGVLLLAESLRIHRGSARAKADSAKRSQAILDRLAVITPKTALIAGTLLGIGGPKRLTIGIVTSVTISGADLTASRSVTVAAIYVAIASMLVWAPVGLYLLTGTRSQGWLTEAEAWLLANERPLTAISLLVFGAILTADGIARLL